MASKGIAQTLFAHFSLTRTAMQGSLKINSVEQINFASLKLWIKLEKITPSPLNLNWNN